jgi:hypothetical protein
MSQCRTQHENTGGDDHHGHGHGHGHDHDHAHDHSDDLTPALQHSLYPRIVFDQITTLNETDRGSGRQVVEKTWADRMQVEPELVSEADEQLLMTVPFTGQVKLHSVLIRTSDSPSAPRTLKLFSNRDDIDFDDALESRPTQELSLSRTSEVQEIPVRRAQFSCVRKLVLFFQDNHYSIVSPDEREYDFEPTRITYLGFKGEWMQVGHAPVQVLYEAAANPKDHLIEGANPFKLDVGKFGV